MISTDATTFQQNTPDPSDANEYVELRHLVEARGLLKRQPAFYAYMITQTVGLLALSIALMALADSLWIHLLSAVLMAFVFTQIGFVGHDAGHVQIFKSIRKNDAILIGVNFLIGLDRSWWIDKHNRRHHSNPNDLELDLDVNLPLIGFTEEQSLAKRGLYRLVVRYQAFLFFPLLLLEAISIRADGIQYLIRGKNVKYPLAEGLAEVAHFVAYFGLVFYLLSPGHAALFILVHQGLIGVYMGSVFAPNHKGMPMISKDNPMGFLRRQVLTARNVKGGFLTDSLYGGLNHQIEHHLFPDMPRNKLKEAKPVVKAFCRQRSISYHETGLLRSNWEILSFLHRVSSPLRTAVHKQAPGRS